MSLMTVMLRFFPPFNGIFLDLNYIIQERYLHAVLIMQKQNTVIIFQNHSQNISFAGLCGFCLWPLFGDLEIFISFSSFVFYFLQLKCSKMDPFELG